jgi:hypothetical protein
MNTPCHLAFLDNPLDLPQSDKKTLDRRRHPIKTATEAAGFIKSCYLLQIPNFAP